MANVRLRTGHVRKVEKGDAKAFVIVKGLKIQIISMIEGLPPHSSQIGDGTTMPLVVTALSAAGQHTHSDAITPLYLHIENRFLLPYK